MAKKIVSSKAGKQDGRTVTSGSSSAGGAVVVPELEALAAKFRSRMSKLTDEQRDIIRSYYGRVTIRALATHFGTSISRVSREIEKMGLKD
jgi:DNA-directed RNA polymerase specialized sigma subunit